MNQIEPLFTVNQSLIACKNYTLVSQLARAHSLACYRKKSRRINSKSCTGGVTKQDRQATCTGAHNIVIRPTPAWIQAAAERPFKLRSQEETSQSTSAGSRRMIAIYFDLDPLFYGLNATRTRILTSVNLVSLTSTTKLVCGISLLIDQIPKISAFYIIHS